LAYRLTPFVAAHLPELTDLWIAAWTKAMPAIDFEARRVWFVERLAALQAQGSEIVCAFDDTNGALAGFLTLDPATGHIDQLAAAPQAWGRGAALVLIGEAKRRSPALKLEVNQDNPRAVRFYEKHAFRRTAASVNPTSGLRTWRYEWRDRGEREKK
jgi:putative acetyltransferase